MEEREDADAGAGGRVGSTRRRPRWTRFWGFIPPGGRCATCSRWTTAGAATEVVARASIRTVADLKGKRVAFLEGSVSQFYLGVLLMRAGLSLNDVAAVNMTAGDAGAAFVAGRVDAAVTWEPWLTRGARAKHGRVLADSSTSPGLIADVMVTTAARLERRLADLRAFYRAWVRAVEWRKANEREADAIMARGVGGWLRKAHVFREVRAGVAWYDDAMNRAFIGRAGAPGTIVRTIGNALALGRQSGTVRPRCRPGFADRLRRGRPGSPGRAMKAGSVLSPKVGIPRRLHAALGAASAASLAGLWCVLSYGGIAAPDLSRAAARGRAGRLGAGGRCLAVPPHRGQPDGDPCRASALASALAVPIGLLTGSFAAVAAVVEPVAGFIALHPGERADPRS